MSNAKVAHNKINKGSSLLHNENFHFIPHGLKDIQNHSIITNYLLLYSRMSTLSWTWLFLSDSSAAGVIEKLFYRDSYFFNKNE